MIGVLYVLCATVLAGPVDTFGFDARAIGRGHGGVAIADGVGGLFNNPASLSTLDGSQALLGVGLFRTALQPLPLVRWDTNRDGM